MINERFSSLEDECYARPSRYRDGYREDEDICVDDQNCGNCLYGGGACPMALDHVETPAAEKRIRKSRRENAVIRDGEPVWCIYWKERRRKRKTL